MGRMSLSLTERAEKKRRRVLAGEISRRRPPEEMAMTVEDAAPAPAPAPTRQKGRSTNYTEAEDIALVKAWERVTLEAGASGNDHTGKRYWQRIANEFHRLTQPEMSSRSFRSLQGRYDNIKKFCSRWSACLEQVRSAPPSGCAVDDLDRVAQERYKQIAASKGKAFGFQHCWKLLEHSEKWKLMHGEGTPPNKRRSNSPFNHLDDDDDGDGEEIPASMENIGRPDERMKVKDNLMLMDQEGPPLKKRRSNSNTTKLDNVDEDDDDDNDDEGIQSSTGNIWEKVDDLMKGGKETAAQPLQMKKQLVEKKQQDKMTAWQHIREIEEKKMDAEKRKMDLEERRLLLEENRLKQEITAEEHKIMMMDPSGMDETARAWWDVRRGEILQSRVWAAGMRDGGLVASGGGDGNGGVA